MQKLACLAAFILSSGAALAQTSGEITGEVKDQSGAVAPNVSVTAINVDTNVARSTQTNDAGIYSFPGLIPGTYNVKVVAAGFEPVTKTNILLQVQQAARVDFALVVGQAAQTIEVSGNGAQLTTENATVGTVIEEKRIVELPLNGRNFFSLVGLSPGVTTNFQVNGQVTGRQGGSRSNVTMSLAGSRTAWNNYTLDGVTNTDINFNLYVLLPSVDAIQEFKVQSGIYPAEFGRELGQVNVSTRPGTNTYHGTLFEFLRNDKLDARSYDFNHTANAPKQPYKQNQYGFTLGGPVEIPKLFNGRNRLFFLSNFEGFKSRTTNVTTATVLTQAMRNGDFSAVPTQLYDPATRVKDPVTGTYSARPFIGNQIPITRFDKSSLYLINNFMPSPNLVSSALPNRNYQYTNSTPIDKDQITERIDFTESTSSQWFGRYSWTDELTVNPGLTVNGSTLYTRASQWVLSNTRILSPTKVNEARFGYNSLLNTIATQLAGKLDVDAAIGVPFKIEPNSWGVPAINLSNNLSPIGNDQNGPFQIDNKTFQAVDNFSWIHGKHSMRMGGEFRRNLFPQFGNEFPRGAFAFTGGFTGDPSIASTPGGYSGADMLLGQVQRVDIAVALAQGDFRNSEIAAYFDDSWKVTPRLTVSLGLRYEIEQPLTDISGRSVTVTLRQQLPNYANEPDINRHPVFVRTGTGDFYEGIDFRYLAAANSATQGQILTARDGRLPDSFVDTDRNNFAPRIGIAYSPNDKWSFRTGFGVFYSFETKNSIFDLNRGLGGRTGVTAPDPRLSSPYTYANFIDPSSLPAKIPAGSLVWGVDPNLRSTYTMSYLLNVQRTLGRGSTLEIGYNGSQSRKLALLYNENAPIPGTAPFATRAPYPEFGAGIQYLKADGVGSYNGLLTKFTQRYGSYFTGLYSYTWSKALDDNSAIRGVGSEFAPQNMRCRACDKGPSTFNVPHRFVASVLATMPFGRGSRFLDRGGIVNQIVGGWQTSTIFSLQNGQPINTSAGWDSAGLNFNPTSIRLHCIAGVDPYLPNWTPERYLNPAAFANPAAGEFGSCGRNNLLGPHIVNVDFAVLKDFHITERQALQFRTEMFNVFNHPEFGLPNTSWGNNNTAPRSNAASFGAITQTVTTMRQIQFALKYNF